MEKDLNMMNMVQLRALTKENNLRGYSRLRKNELIDMLFELLEVTNNEENQTNKELTTNKRKKISQKASKLSKKSKSLRIDINNLKSQKDELEEKIRKVSSTKSAKFKGKKIRSMKREANRLNNLIMERAKELEKIETNPNTQEMFKITQQSSKNKRIRKKIEDLNRKIRRVRGVNKTNNKAKNRLISKREALKLQLIDTTPSLIEGAFGGNYSKYRIEGIEGMDVSTYLSKIRASIGNVLRKETSRRAIRCQITTWIRFEKEDDYVDKAFNSRMTPVYMHSEMDSIVQEMVNYIEKQVDNPKLRDSKFVIDRILRTDISCHRLMLTRGSSFIKLPDGLASRKAILNPKNLDEKCFKWAVIAGLKWEEIDCHPERVSKLRRYESEFDWSGITYPVSTKTISKFETRNGIGVNLLAIDGRTIYICRKGGDYERKVNLMILEERERKHYVAIKSLERLLSMSINKYKEKKLL